MNIMWIWRIVDFRPGDVKTVVVRVASNWVSVSQSNGSGGEAV